MNSPEPTAVPNPPPAESQLTRAKECTTNYVRENPVSTIFGALAMGLVVGWLLHRRPQPSWGDRYVSGPAGKIRDWAVSTADQAGEGLRHYGDRTAEMAQTAASAVGRGLGKLRFW